jgi:uncharacterized phiE125 gp8 family phage protein
MQLQGYYNNPNICGRWAVQVATPPASEPVTVAELKTHARIDLSDDDTLLGLYITSAREWVEQHLERSLIDQTFVLYLDAVPVGQYLELPFPKLDSITHIKYYDSTDTLQTWASSNYRADTVSPVGRVTLKNGISWPSLITDRTDALQITYVAGYGSAASSVPESLKTAIKLLATHWYENREATAMGNIGKEIEFSLTSILSLYKVVNL